MRLNRIENVVIKNNDKSVELQAKIDTGADRTSIDYCLAQDLGLRILNKTKKVFSANGRKQVRKLVEVNFLLKDKWVSSVANLADRSHMKYKMIIGCNDLKGCVVVV